MVPNNSTKGNMIRLSMFTSRSCNTFGVKTKKNDQDESVYQVWCKIMCCKQGQDISPSSSERRY